MTHDDHHRLGRQRLTERTATQPWTAGYADGDARSARSYDSRDPENFDLKGFDEAGLRASAAARIGGADLGARARAILREAPLDAGAIDVTLVDGRVVLRGRVDDADSSLLAEQLLAPLAGRRQLRNELVIRRPAPPPDAAVVHRIDGPAGPH